MTEENLNNPPVVNPPSQEPTAAPVQAAEDTPQSDDSSHVSDETIRITEQLLDSVGDTSGQPVTIDNSADIPQDVKEDVSVLMEDIRASTLTPDPDCAEGTNETSDENPLSRVMTSYELSELRQLAVLHTVKFMSHRAPHASIDDKLAAELRASALAHGVRYVRARLHCADASVAAAHSQAMEELLETAAAPQEDTAAKPMPAAVPDEVRANMSALMEDIRASAAEAPHTAAEAVSASDDVVSNPLSRVMTSYELSELRQLAVLHTVKFMASHRPQQAAVDDRMAAELRAAALAHGVRYVRARLASTAAAPEDAAGNAGVNGVVGIVEENQEAGAEAEADAGAEAEAEAEAEADAPDSDSSAAAAVEALLDADADADDAAGAPSQDSRALMAALMREVRAGARAAPPAAEAETVAEPGADAEAEAVSNPLSRVMTSYELSELRQLAVLHAVKFMASHRPHAAVDARMAAELRASALAHGVRYVRARLGNAHADDDSNDNVSSASAADVASAPPAPAPAPAPVSLDVDYSDVLARLRPAPALVPAPFDDAHPVHADADALAALHQQVFAPAAALGAHDAELTSAARASRLAVERQAGVLVAELGRAVKDAPGSTELASALAAAQAMLASTKTQVGLLDTLCAHHDACTENNTVCATAATEAASYVLANTQLRSRVASLEQQLAAARAAVGTARDVTLALVKEHTDLAAAVADRDAMLDQARQEAQALRAEFAAALAKKNEDTELARSVMVVRERLRLEAIDAEITEAIRVVRLQILSKKAEMDALRGRGGKAVRQEYYNAAAELVSSLETLLAKKTAVVRAIGHCRRDEELLAADIVALFRDTPQFCPQKYLEAARGDALVESVRVAQQPQALSVAAGAAEADVEEAEEALETNGFRILIASPSPAPTPAHAAAVKAEAAVPETEAEAEADVRAPTVTFSTVPLESDTDSPLAPSPAPLPALAEASEDDEIAGHSDYIPVYDQGSVDALSAPAATLQASRAAAWWLEGGRGVVTGLGTAAGKGGPGSVSELTLLDSVINRDVTAEDEAEDVSAKVDRTWLPVRSQLVDVVAANAVLSSQLVVAEAEKETVRKEHNRLLARLRVARAQNRMLRLYAGPDAVKLCVAEAEEELSHIAPTYKAVSGLYLSADVSYDTDNVWADGINWEDTAIAHFEYTGTDEADAMLQTEGQLQHILAQVHEGAAEPDDEEMEAPVGDKYLSGSKMYKSAIVTESAPSTSYSSTPSRSRSTTRTRAGASALRSPSASCPQPDMVFARKRSPSRSKPATDLSNSSFPVLAPLASPRSASVSRSRTATPSRPPRESAAPSAAPLDTGARGTPSRAPRGREPTLSAITPRAAHTPTRTRARLPSAGPAQPRTARTASQDSRAGSTYTTPAAAPAERGYSSTAVPRRTLRGVSRERAPSTSRTRAGSSVRNNQIPDFIPSGVLHNQLSTPRGSYVSNASPVRARSTSRAPALQSHALYNNNTAVQTPRGSSRHATPTAVRPPASGSYGSTPRRPAQGSPRPSAPASRRPQPASPTAMARASREMGSPRARAPVRTPTTAMKQTRAFMAVSTPGNATPRTNMTTRK